MLNIIGLILRIIGIVLGSLAGLLLLFVLLALFVPLRYRGFFCRKPEEQQIDIRAGWLFRLLSIRLYWQQEKPRITVRIAGFFLFDSTRPKRKRKKLKADTIPEESKLEQSENGQNPELLEEPEEPKLLEDIAENPEAIKKEQESTVQESKKVSEEAVLEEQKEQDQNKEKLLEDSDVSQIEPALEQTESNSSSEKHIWKRIFLWFRHKIEQIKKLFQLILSIFHRIVDFFIHFRQSLFTLADKLRMLRSKAGVLQLFLTDTGNRNGFSAIIQMLRIAGKHILPYRLTGKVLFGTGDAYSTAQILVYAGMFYGIYGKNFNLEADFEERRLEVEIKLKGRIRLIQLLLYVFRLWKTAEFRKLLKNVKQLKEEL